MPSPRAETLRPLVGDLRQLASVRRMVLDDGPERGVPVLALSSGGGLDLWLLAGRGLDIGPLWFRGRPMAWQAPPGYAHPALSVPDRDAGRGIQRLLSGFLTTCGLERIRQGDATGPLHGRLGCAPARVLAAGEHWDRDEPVIEVVAQTVQYRLGGESLLLHRRVQVPIGGCTLRLEDRVTNEGPQSQAHELLYHFNLGHPAIGPGTRVVRGDQTLAGPLAMPLVQACGEASCLCADDAAVVVRTPGADGLGLSITFACDASTLPWLQLWHDLRPRCGLLCVEPCTSERVHGGRSASTPFLEPGESRCYRVEIGFAESDERPTKTAQGDDR
jgi:hypothetical protein